MRIGQVTSPSLRCASSRGASGAPAICSLSSLCLRSHCFGADRCNYGQSCPLRFCDNFHNSGGYGPAYLAFEFKDSSKTGSPLRYGWVGITVANGDLYDGDYPQLTVSGWAYDDTGAQIAMGFQGPVPEPSSMALLALGALTLGAAGVRSWRRNRAAASQA